MQSGNAERVRHVERDFEELAEVRGTHCELDLSQLPKWQDVLASGKVWKSDTARLSCSPGQMCLLHTLLLFTLSIEPSPP